jgi:DNA-binding MarR family transcriptional regulator
LNELLQKVASKVDEIGSHIMGVATEPPLDAEALPFFAQLYRERRLRDRVFEIPDLFAEPAWDILLGLARAEYEGRQSSVTSLCEVSCVSPTTALRWISRLEEAALIERRGDPRDNRRVFISLTSEGRRKLRIYAQRMSTDRDGRSD